MAELENSAKGDHFGTEKTLSIDKEGDEVLVKISGHQDQLEKREHPKWDHTGKRNKRSKKISTVPPNAWNLEK